MSKKNFRNEIEKMYDRLISGNKFSFSKYADGEWAAINKVKMTNGEWIMYQDHPKYEASRKMLIDSFQFKDPDYYVGISCPCCQGIETFEKMKMFSGQDTDNLTFANIFVNSNYSYFVENFIPSFNDFDIVLIANSNSDISKLPFKVNHFYPIIYDAWVNDIELVDRLIRINHQNKLFLFSCGPLGNILSHKLWETNKNNTYLDIGSTVDRWLNNDMGNKRCYHLNIGGYSDKVCVWD